MIQDEERGEEEEASEAVAAPFFKIKSNKICQISFVFILSPSLMLCGGGLTLGETERRLQQSYSGSPCCWLKVTSLHNDWQQRRVINSIYVILKIFSINPRLHLPPPHFKVSSASISFLTAGEVAEVGSNKTHLYNLELLRCFT